MIKIIAILTMLLDHIGEVFFPNAILFTIVGRLAFPLFAWGIAKGFKRTSNVKMYALRLLALAVISQYPHYLLFKSDYLNVCFTLLVGLLILQLYKSKISYLIKWPAIVVLLMVSHIFNFEYGIYGIATIVIFYLFEGEYYLIFLQVAATVFGIILYGYYPIQFISVLSTLIVIFLEKYDFRISKAVQYGFYPAHIMMLLLLSNIFSR